MDILRTGRRTGFYFIIYSEGDEWEPAKWDRIEESWRVIDLPVPADESDIFKINEERILPPNN